MIFFKIMFILFPLRVFAAVSDQEANSPLIKAFGAHLEFIEKTILKKHPNASDSVDILYSIFSNDFCSSNTNRLTELERFVQEKDRMRNHQANLTKNTKAFMESYKRIQQKSFSCDMNTSLEIMCDPSIIGVFVELYGKIEEIHRSLANILGEFALECICHEDEEEQVCIENVLASYKKEQILFQKNLYENARLLSTKLTLEDSHNPLENKAIRKSSSIKRVEWQLFLDHYHAFTYFNSLLKDVNSCKSGLSTDSLKASIVCVPCFSDPKQNRLEAQSKREYGHGRMNPRIKKIVARDSFKSEDAESSSSSFPSLVMSASMRAKDAASPERTEQKTEIIQTPALTDTTIAQKINQTLSTESKTEDSDDFEYESHYIPTTDNSSPSKFKILIILFLIFMGAAILIALVLCE